MARKKTSSLEKIDSVKPIKGVIVNCHLLNVRKSPDTKSNIVSVLEVGKNVNILEKLNGWYKVDNGYVKSDFINVVE